MEHDYRNRLGLPRATRNDSTVGLVLIAILVALLIVV